LKKVVALLTLLFILPVLPVESSSRVTLVIDVSADGMRPAIYLNGGKVPQVPYTITGSAPLRVSLAASAGAMGKARIVWQKRIAIARERSGTLRSPPLTGSFLVTVEAGGKEYTLTLSKGADSKGWIFIKRLVKLRGRFSTSMWYILNNECFYVKIESNRYAWVKVKIYTVKVVSFRCWVVKDSSGRIVKVSRDRSLALELGEGYWRAIAVYSTGAMSIEAYGEPGAAKITFSSVDSYVGTVIKPLSENLPTFLCLGGEGSIVEVRAPDVLVTPLITHELPRCPRPSPPIQVFWYKTPFSLGFSGEDVWVVACAKYNKRLFVSIVKLCNSKGCRTVTLKAYTCDAVKKPKNEYLVTYFDTDAVYYPLSLETLARDGLVLHRLVRPGDKLKLYFCCWELRDLSGNVKAVYYSNPAYLFVRKGAYVLVAKYSLKPCGHPLGRIISVSAPRIARAGEEALITCVVKNVGTAAGNFLLVIRNLVTDQTFKVKQFRLGPGEETTLLTSVQVPGYCLPLRLELWRGEALDDFREVEICGWSFNPAGSRWLLPGEVIPLELKCPGSYELQVVQLSNVSTCITALLFNGTRLIYVPLNGSLKVSCSRDSCNLRKVKLGHHELPKMHGKFEGWELVGLAVYGPGCRCNAAEAFLGGYTKAAFAIMIGPNGVSYLYAVTLPKVDVAVEYGSNAISLTFTARPALPVAPDLNLTGFCTCTPLTQDLWLVVRIGSLLYRVRVVNGSASLTLNSSRVRELAEYAISRGSISGSVKVFWSGPAVEVAAAPVWNLEYPIEVIPITLKITYLSDEGGLKLRGMVSMLNGRELSINGKLLVVYEDLGLVDEAPIVNGRVSYRREGVLAKGGVKLVVVPASTEGRLLIPIELRV